MANDILTVVQGIANAIGSKKHDGAGKVDGNWTKFGKETDPIKIGLQREEGEWIKDPRVIDAFNVRFSGNKLIVKYSFEKKLSQIYRTKVEEEAANYISQIVKFIKKEYSKEHGSLTLKKEGEIKVSTEYISSVRVRVVAAQEYVLSGGVKNYKDPSSDEYQDKNRSAIEKFLAEAVEKHGYRQPKLKMNQNAFGYDNTRK